MRSAPGAIAALRHHHRRQDEFVYILQGHPTLMTDAGATDLAPDMCAGFKALLQANGSWPFCAPGRHPLRLKPQPRCA